jgi:methionine-rich copper-binding protein CopC
MPWRRLQAAQRASDVTGMGKSISRKPTLRCQGIGRQGIWVALRLAAMILAVAIFGQHAQAGSSASPGFALLSQHPVPMQVVPAQPVVLSLVFNQPVDHHRSILQLVFPGGKERRIAARLGAGPATLYAMLGRLPPGNYELRWHARCLNGEMLAGILPFTVAQAMRARASRNR